ncbi:MarR family winged helix-turn-helix transcriptional regulator [Saccharopolyspora griseoalba]|uniref:MarR family winged helix-turn-helix transcriptional regulator n=1 Tax=Saccharopolyspora griseoalba TaxID=1431848 RepID=A0ABW2LP13_9PSEU
MDTAAELSRLLGPLRRSVLRATRGAEGLPDLPEAQIELLRTLATAGPLGPGEAARRMGVANSTVSNLVRAMGTADLVRRERSPEDFRAVRLAPTETALDFLDRYDRTSTAALAEAIARLPPDEREALAAAIPVLAHLAEDLDGRRSQVLRCSARRCEQPNLSGRS